LPITAARVEEPTVSIPSMPVLRIVLAMMADSTPPDQIPP
jgi:hypothetical protein